MRVNLLVGIILPLSYAYLGKESMMCTQFYGQSTDVQNVTEFQKIGENITSK